MAPFLRVDGDAVLATWLEPDADGHRLQFARWERAAWSAPVTIARGSKLVANWADTPSVAAGGDGALVAHWAERNGSEPHAYDAVIARSTDRGATWRRLGTPHRDGTSTEHGFVSLASDRTGVRAVWLDGRATGAAGGATALRTAVVGEQIGEETVIDDRVCDCCGTGLVATHAGFTVVYRDRTGDEIRDIAVATGGGAAWQPHGTVHADNWKIPGCPVNGPAIAANGELVAVAWFTVADGSSRVRAAFSRDGGRTFGKAIEVDGPRDARAPLGRVAIVLLDGDAALVSWLASRREAGEILARRVSASGELGAEVTLGATRAGRNAGFPRMVRLGAEVIVAWTDPAPKGRLRVARVPLARFAGRSTTAPAAAPAPAVAQPGTAVPDVLATTLDGAAASLAALRGKPVLVNVWATWCEPCRHELPALAALYQRYAPRGLELVAISVDREASAADVAKFAKRFALPFPVWLDAADRTSSALGVRTLPVTLLVDREGVIRWRRDATVSADDADLSRALESVLAPTPR